MDTWKGDEQAGFYGEDVFHDIASYMHEKYAGHAHLVRTTFDEAVNVFDDGGIDLLHIDGYHSKEAMLHDFETWLPKMSERGVILMHDVNARIPGYSGFEAWLEISSRYPHFKFDHSYGLGAEIAEIGQRHTDEIAAHIKRRGDEVAAERQNTQAEQEINQSLRQEVSHLREIIDGYENSKSWKLTKPLRMLKKAVAGKQ